VGMHLSYLIQELCRISLNSTCSSGGADGAHCSFSGKEDQIKSEVTASKGKLTNTELILQLKYSISLPRRPLPSHHSL
jgi:hypothetical protein